MRQSQTGIEIDLGSWMQSELLGRSEQHFVHLGGHRHETMGTTTLRNKHHDDFVLEDLYESMGNVVTGTHSYFVYIASLVQQFLLQLRMKYPIGSCAIV